MLAIRYVQRISQSAGFLAFVTAVLIPGQVAGIQCLTCEGLFCFYHPSPPITECPSDHLCFKSDNIFSIKRGCYPKTKAGCITTVVGGSCYDPEKDLDMTISNKIGSCINAAFPEPPPNKGKTCVCDTDNCNQNVGKQMLSGRQG